MKTKKKSKFMTFCFSFIPGGGQMYMGFMKTGLSLMLLFALTIIVASWTNQGALATICVVEWVYSFFYTNHLASLDDEEFSQVEDTYLFGLDSIPRINILGEKYHKWVAVILIFIGVCFLWNSLADLLYDVLPQGYRFLSNIMWRIGNYVPSVLIGVAIIALGLKMLEGKKITLERPAKEDEQDVEETRKIVDTFYRDVEEKEGK